jgi:hypothetical protein
MPEKQLSLSFSSRVVEKGRKVFMQEKRTSQIFDATFAFTLTKNPTLFWRKHHQLKRNDGNEVEKERKMKKTTEERKETSYTLLLFCVLFTNNNNNNQKKKT